MPGAAPGRKGSGCFKLSAEEKVRRGDVAKSVTRKLKGVGKVSKEMVLCRFGMCHVPKGGRQIVLCESSLGQKRGYGYGGYLAHIFCPKMPTLYVLCSKKPCLFW